MPDATARMALVNEKVKQSSAFYFSFNADPWPLMFYLRLNGSGDKEFLFDGPRGMVKGLPDSCTVILKLDEDQSALAKRFPGQWHFLFKNSNHQLWSYSL